MNKASEINEWRYATNKRYETNMQQLKDMKQIMVVIRRGQNEHLKQGERTKTNFIFYNNKTYINT